LVYVGVLQRAMLIVLWGMKFKSLLQITAVTDIALDVSMSTKSIFMQFSHMKIKEFGVELNAFNMS